MGARSWERNLMDLRAEMKEFGEVTGTDIHWQLLLDLLNYVWTHEWIWRSWWGVS